MSKASKLVKDMVKSKRETVMGKLGDSPYENPYEPWSVKYNSPVKEENIEEAGTGLLMSYIKAKGVDPSMMNTNKKNAYSKSSEYRIFRMKHRIKKETSGMGERGDDWNEENKAVKEEVDEKDTVTLDIPLMIRIVEFAREDAKTDMDLHRIVENLINLRHEGVLTMNHYEQIVNIKKIKEAVEQIVELKKMPDNMDADDHITREDLRKWFSKTDPEGDWKRINSKGEVVGPCAREPGEPKPKCMSKEKRSQLSKSERASAVAAKRKHDPNPERKGKPINVSNYGKGKLSEDSVDEACWDTHKQVGMKKKGVKMVPDCVPKNEEVEQIDEKNKPTNPKLWSRAVSMARSKFSVYPCVPLDSLAISKKGPISHDELEIGDEILTYNMKEDKLEWKPVLYKHYYENAPLLEIGKKTGFSIRCTPNHKWVIKKSDRNELIETKNLNTHMHILICSVMKNESSLVLENWSKNDNWVEKILSMNQKEREIFLASSIVYDGWDKGVSTKIKDRHTFGFVQKEYDHLWASLLASYLNGYYVNTNERGDITSATYIRNKIYHSTQNLYKKEVASEDVWCPTTENETWVMIQNGLITITGNSAYANGWASKWYKSKGGGWKSVKEEVLDEQGLGNKETSPMAATDSVKAMESTHRNRQMKSARIIKSIYRKKMRETMYDWEKDDKGEKKPNAKIVLTGGKTMTGKDRDTVEIDPVLRTRPNLGKPTV